MADRISRANGEAPKLWRQMFCLASIGAMGCGIVLYLFAEQIVDLMLGQGFPDSVAILRIMSPVPFIAVCGEMLGTYWLLANNKDALLTRIVTAVTLVHVPLMLILGWAMGALGGGMALLLSQTLAIIFRLFRMSSVQPNPLHLNRRTAK